MILSKIPEHVLTLNNTATAIPLDINSGRIPLYYAITGKLSVASTSIYSSYGVVNTSDTLKVCTIPVEKAMKYRIDYMNMLLNSKEDIVIDDADIEYKEYTKPKFYQTFTEKQRVTEELSTEEVRNNLLTHLRIEKKLNREILL